MPPTVRNDPFPPSQLHTFHSAAVANGNGTSIYVGGAGVFGIQVLGLTASTINFEANIDETTWVAVRAQNANTGVVATTTTANGLFRLNCTGLNQIRCRISNYGGADSITVTGKMQPSDSAGGAAASSGISINAEKVEDAAHVSGDTGAFVLAVRNDAAAATFTSVDGDYSPIAVDAQGRVGISDLGGSITIDNTTLAVVGGGAEATALRVTVANDSTGVLSVDDNAGSLTIDNSTLAVVGGGAEATALRVTIANDSTGVLSVDDNAGSLTIDNSTLAVVGGGAEATALRVTIANDSTGVLSVDDNAGSLTIDNSTLAVVGGGAELTALRVTIANDSTGVLSVDDNAGSLTIDNSTLAVVGGGAEATAMRVTIANDSTGLVSVDDNGGNLSVDWGGTVPPIGAGLEATALRVTVATDSTGVLSVDDNGASLTIDNSTLAVVGGGAEATALRVTIANDSTGVLSVDDNAGSLTVDGTVTANQGTANATPWNENVAQIGGTAVVTGNGVTGAGSQRVTIASDNSAVPTKIDQTTPGTTNGVTLVPSTAAAANLSTSGTAAQVSNRVVKASAGTLFVAIGYNNNAATRYIQVFDAAALPADTTVPNLPPIPVATGQNWSLNLGEYGYKFTTGIVIANSTTAATLTIASADQFINATYI